MKGARCWGHEAGAVEVPSRQLDLVCLEKGRVVFVPTVHCLVSALKSILP